jgi:uncharacterized protein (UPF0332 family)
MIRSGPEVAYHDDLLQQALQLVQNEPRKPKQASLRRAVSTAYYALFHMLISESVANWRIANLRSELARAFDHGTMKAASDRLLQFRFPGEKPPVAALKFMAKTFGELQQNRHKADYDNTKFWMKTEALDLVRSAERAFDEWRSIRDEQIAQNYLLSLLVKKRT